jgi:hypothetical protein
MWLVDDYQSDVTLRRRSLGFPDLMPGMCIPWMGRSPMPPSTIAASWSVGSMLKAMHCRTLE